MNKVLKVPNLENVTRDPKNIVFIGRSDSQFAGNTKHLFLHFIKEEADFKATYITLNRDTYFATREARLPILLFPDEKAVIALAEAGTIVVDDFHYREMPIQLFVQGAKIIQLWHGVGLKKIGYLEAESGVDLTDERRDYLRRMYSGYDAVVSTSPFYTEHLFKTSFGAKAIWETGYPRNDVLFRKPGKLDFLGSDNMLYGELKQLARQGLKSCIYAPTFRDDGNDPFAAGALDVAELNAFLAARHMRLYVKMHQFSASYGSSEFSNIALCPNTVDIYPLLPMFDCMITDYSSISTDYLLVDKPLILFPYDHDVYTNALREFQFDYNDMMPGPKCFNQTQLHEALMTVSLGIDEHAQQRQTVRSLAFAHTDGLAAKRIAEHIRRL